MKKNFLIVLLLAATGLGACNRCDDGPKPLPAPGKNTGNGSGSGGGNGIAPGGCYVDCTTVLCTADFRQEHIDVRDAGGAAVALDSFVVTDLSGTPLAANSGQKVYGYPFNGGGQYTVINDGWLDGHQNSSMTVRAKGFIGGNLVFDEPYTVMADCCHVSLTSGNRTVTVTNSN